MLNLERLRAASLAHDPYDHVFVQGMVAADELTDLVRDFPDVPSGGSFDAGMLETGPAFQKLIAEMRTDAFRQEVERLFDIDLGALPLHVTVRGHVREKDGAIHTDSKEKVLTGLLYLNPEWTEAGGRLRLLRNGKDIDNYVIEVPPLAGNMLIFRRGENSWHGHLPSEGRRLSLQFNWVTDDSYVRRELARHRLSGRVKRLFGRPTAH